jgi:hypothetical protein
MLRCRRQKVERGQHCPRSGAGEPLSRTPVNNVGSSQSCQRDVPKVSLLKAALVSSAGEVGKLQHLDFHREALP